ncbi:MAG: glycoside hydrolase N-terminal domain-containing protein, partial [Planctomycetota bacterium]
MGNPLVGVCVCCIVCLVLVCSLASAEAGPGAVDGEHLLWYRRSARKWTEALPLGNGRLGAMVFGAVPKERIQL